MPCQRVLLSGPRQGQACNRPLSRGGDICSYHMRYDAEAEVGAEARRQMHALMENFDPYDSGDEFDSDSDSEFEEPLPPIRTPTPEVVQRIGLLQGALMDGLTTVVYPETPKECSICFAEGNEMFCAVRTKACEHDFCIGCLRKWIAADKLTCPVCRTDIRRNTFLDLRKKK